VLDRVAPRRFRLVLERLPGELRRLLGALDERDTRNDASGSTGTPAWCAAKWERHPGSALTIAAAPAAWIAPIRCSIIAAAVLSNSVEKTPPNPQQGSRNGRGMTSTFAVSDSHRSNVPQRSTSHTS
jgi:hypothetical protein